MEFVGRVVCIKLYWKCILDLEKKYNLAINAQWNYELHARNYYCMYSNGCTLNVQEKGGGASESQKHRRTPSTATKR